MPFGYIGAAIGGALISGHASEKAAKTQSDSANRAQDIQKQMFDIINAQQAPYREAGVGALGQMTNLTNLNPSNPQSFLHPFNASDLTANLAPNWQFALQQGQGATQNMLNASGGNISGNTMKGISDYTLAKSGDLYQNAFQNYTANQTNIFNRLASIAGLGQTANQATAAAGVPIAQGIGQAGMAGASARAAGQVGVANALTGGINNAAAFNWYHNLGTLGNDTGLLGAGMDTWG